MNTCRSFMTLVALLVATHGLHAQTENTFDGRSEDWFDALNWSARKLPSSALDVRIENQRVVLEPPRPGMTIELGTVTLRNGGEWVMRNARVNAVGIDSDASLISLQSSHLSCGYFWDPSYGGGVLLNPSFVETDHFRLTKLNGVAGFGIGGALPAGPGALGAGRHARVLTPWAELDGQLRVEFLHGFEPSIGQSFKIIEVTGPQGTGSGLHGRFANYAEGDLVARFCSVGLSLTYQGGDGNDVVLTAVPLPSDVKPEARFMPATPGANAWENPANWSCGVVPIGGETDVLIDGEFAELLGSRAPAGVTHEYHRVLLRSGARLLIDGAIFNAQRIDSEGSDLLIRNSQINVVEFWDPWGSTASGGGSTLLNPSYVQCLEFRLTKLFTGTMGFGIDGTTPAGPGAVGPGHFARVQTQTAALDGRLEVFFPHDFAVSAGQTFEIITVLHPVTPGAPSGLTGTFHDTPEGSLVGRQGHVGFFITYQGGDGNDVVLETRTLTSADLPFSFFRGGINYLDGSNWLPAGVPGAATDALLRDRVSLIEPAVPGGTVTIGTLFVRDGANLGIRNARVIGTKIDSVGSDVLIQNSYVNLVEYWDPFGSTSTGGSTLLNPSLLECGLFKLTKLQSGKMSFGIDGVTPAADGAVGPGHYARVVCDDAQLDGMLDLTFPYGFKPQAGQSFQIITVNNPQTATTGRSGRFRNAREGDPVMRVDDVVLFVTYEGGDGNDVTLNAYPALDSRHLRRAATGEGFEMDVTTLAGRVHYVEIAEDLVGPWDVIDTFVGTGAPRALLLPAVQKARWFVRVR